MFNPWQVIQQAIQQAIQQDGCIGRHFGAEAYVKLPTEEPWLDYLETPPMGEDFSWSSGIQAAPPWGAKSMTMVGGTTSYYYAVYTVEWYDYVLHLLLD